MLLPVLYLNYRIKIIKIPRKKNCLKFIKKKIKIKVFLIYGLKKIRIDFKKIELKGISRTRPIIIKTYHKSFKTEILKTNNLSSF